MPAKFKVSSLPPLLLALGVTSLADQAAAQTSPQIAESVYTLDFNRGDRELGLKLGTLDQRRAGRTSEAQLSLGYGVSDRWMTGLALQYERLPAAGTRLDAIEWENRLRLTEAGRLPVEFGLLAEFERARDRDDGYRLKFGPLLQTDVGRVQLNANLLFQRYYSETPSRPTEMSYQWQAKYKTQQSLQFGAQGFGEVGKWDDWAPRSEQSHRFGPALFGEVDLGGARTFEYNAAYLIDPSSSTRSHGFKLQAEYKF